VLEPGAIIAGKFHVCRVLDVGRLEGGAPYIAMELLQGSDLAVVLGRGALSLTTATGHVLQVCVGLVEVALALSRPKFTLVAVDEVVLPGRSPHGPGECSSARTGSSGPSRTPRRRARR
jgi:hypothetical protein